MAFLCRNLAIIWVCRPFVCSGSTPWISDRSSPNRTQTNCHLFQSSNLHCSMIISLDGWGSGWEPHWQGASNDNDIIIMNIPGLPRSLPNANQYRSKLRYWSQCRSLRILIDQQWSALRGISYQCQDFDWHWSRESWYINPANPDRNFAHKSEWPLYVWEVEGRNQRSKIKVKGQCQGQSLAYT